MKKVKFKQKHHINWFVLLWGCSIVLAGLLFFRWQIDKNFLGIVERRTHFITPQESGRIQTMLVESGERVAKDQLLAILYMTDLKANLENLRTELNRMQQLESARQNTYTMQIERLRLRLDNEASDLVERLALIESKSAELASLNSLIQRLQTSQEAGLGYNRDLAELNIQRDALLAYLQKLRAELPGITAGSEDLSITSRSLQETDLDEMSKALLTEDLQHTEELRREIVETEHRIGMRTLVAPCDGYVTHITAGQGDVVKAFDSIMTVEESVPSRMTLYIPEHSTMQPVIGSPVRIYSSRSKSFTTTGIVTFIHPGFTRAEDRISFRGQVFWARKVQVDLAENHQLVPGEVVNVRIPNHGALVHRFNNNIAAAGSAKLLKEHDPNQPPSLKSMNVPQDLWQLTNFEPSGIVWNSDLGEFLLVSDDTGVNDTETEHAPYIFRMNPDGQVSSHPLELRKITSVNDLEGITAVNTTEYYLVSSQNISKKGKRPANREFLLHVIRNGSDFIVEERIKLLSLVLQTYSEVELKQLGLVALEEDQQPEINIEGLAFDGQALYFGLKEPITAAGAIIWKLDNPQKLFANNRLEEGQLTLFGTVNLKRAGGEPAGISDMCFDQNGRLWVLSTIPNADRKDQVGALHCVARFADGRLEAETIYHFPGLKPEGLCFQDRSRLWIVFDQDNDQPFYCVVNTEKL